MAENVGKINLLILTQKVDINDPILGFFHRWVEEFAKHCNKLTVVCLQEGEHHLPQNVKVLSLGKEGGESKTKYLFNFYKYIWRERKNYDSVFVHMNQGYVILGGLIWRLLSKKIGLWYAHGHVSFSLRVAERISSIIFTSTKSGFRMNSKKINIIGQGIDTEIFKPDENKVINGSLKIITVGRISPVKDIETLIRAAEMLRNDDQKFSIEIIGSPGLQEQVTYLDNLKKMVTDRNLGDQIKFIGPVTNNKIPGYLKSADLFVNMSHTGSLDKVILEAMAVGLPVATCNESVVDIFGKLKGMFMFRGGDVSELSEKIKMIKNLSVDEKKLCGDSVRGVVVEKHSLSNFVKKILKEYE